MEILSERETFRRACDAARGRGERVGLVPTMGALHEGHVALVEEAKKHAPFVVVSVFVNPTQFGPNEDFARYPRNLEADAEACARAGASLVFAPPASAMYPLGEETRVRVGATASTLCGPHRPGHFEGVATVVTKFFALAGPCVAVFGRKDYQQTRVIARLVEDLFLPIDLVFLRTVREPDGLALSSRNAYLSPEERAKALAIPRGLSAATHAFSAGERRVSALLDPVRRAVGEVATSIDYADLADATSLRVLGSDERVGERVLLALAIRIGKTRLIDNVVLGEDPPPIASTGEP